MHKLFIIYIIPILFIAMACRNEKEFEIEKINRTIIGYIAADNDLATDALSDMEEMWVNISIKN